MSEILEEPPGPEGDDSEAGGGKPTDPVSEDELADADELEEDEVNEPRHLGGTEDDDGSDA